MKTYRNANELHEDLILLTRWMAGEGFTASEVADGVEKPWGGADEIDAARAVDDAARKEGGR